MGHLLAPAGFFGRGFHWSLVFLVFAFLIRVVFAGGCPAAGSGIATTDKDSTYLIAPAFLVGA